jgi:hypothetical protein
MLKAYRPAKMARLILVRISLNAAQSIWIDLCLNKKAAGVEFHPAALVFLMR